MLREQTDDKRDETPVMAYVHLAVQAHIRHSKTNYDELLFKGYDRYDARQIVREQIDEILSKWSRK